jgi:HSP20 family protein
MSMDLERQSGRQVEVERTRNRPVLTPAVDIYETNEKIVVTADMPGVDDKGVEITLEQDVLTIEGRVVDEERPGCALVLSEFNRGDYRRVFTISTDIEREKISAEMKDGVLTLVLPKAEPAKAKKIVVRAAG